MSRVLFSAAAAYVPAAKQELLAAFPAATIERLGSETGCLQADDVELPEVAVAARCRPLVFVRHLMREISRMPLPRSDADIAALCDAAADLLREQHVGPDVALQVWQDGADLMPIRPDELWRRIAARLTEARYAVARGNRDHVLSLCATPAGISLGLNVPADALSDWPGGRVGLARDAGQISRAEFKLDELFQVCELPLPAGGVALDLGASPGGWTRVLRRRGFAVWAVDPAPLDPRLAGDPAVHTVRTTAGRFLDEHDLTVDLIVNDIRMTPSLSCQLMLQAATRLRPGGLAIVTLKLSPREPLRTVHAALRTLARSYEIVFARQLFHNRNEVTVVARRRLERREGT